ncbi:hypothetical protein ACWC5O_39600 [Streptomyces sp. NPDC001450]
MVQRPEAANILDDDQDRINPVDQEINHIPAKASYAHLDMPGFRTNKNGGGAGMGPANCRARAPARKATNGARNSGSTRRTCLAPRDLGAGGFHGAQPRWGAARRPATQGAVGDASDGDAAELQALDGVHGADADGARVLRNIRQPVPGVEEGLLSEPSEADAAGDPSHALGLRRCEKWDSSVDPCRKQKVALCGSSPGAPTSE